MLIAHRGYSSHAPENTLSAFWLAVQHGYRDIEFDVQLSKDGVPVIIHDDTVDRTTDGQGKVADHTFAQLQKLDAGAWFSMSYAGEHIPSLEEVLIALKGKACLHIELKSDEPELPTKVAQLLSHTGWLKDALRQPRFQATRRPRLVVSSFDREQLARSIELLSPTIMHELLVVNASDESLEWAARHKIRSYHPDGNLITPELVRKARKLGMHVGAWWWTRQEQDIRLVRRHGIRYAFVDSPHLHR